MPSSTSLRQIAHFRDELGDAAGHAAPLGQAAWIQVSAPRQKAAAHLLTELCSPDRELAHCVRQLGRCAGAGRGALQGHVQGEQAGVASRGFHGAQQLAQVFSRVEAVRRVFRAAHPVIALVPGRPWAAGASNNGEQETGFRAAGRS